MTRVLAVVVVVLLGAVPGRAQLRPDARSLARAAPELVTQLKTDPFDYFRFVNHAWATRVCEIFAADVRQLPTVRLHGDAHIEQYAFTSTAWGLDDFDDSVRGPALIDIVRFLGSVDLAARQRGWTAQRQELFTSFFEGYRRGVTQPAYLPPEPAIVRRLRATYTDTRAEFLAWGESKMDPMTDESLGIIVRGMKEFGAVIRSQRPELPPDYFEVKRAGWLHLGVGSAAVKKVLIRVRGPSSNPDDDELLEAKAVGYLGDIPCLDVRASPPALRIIAGSQQLGRLKHNILAAGPELVIPEIGADGKQPGDWWIRSWDPSYHEVRITDFTSARDLGAIVYDSGVQLGAGSVAADGKDGSAGGAATSAVRQRALKSLAALEGRLRKETVNLVDSLMRGWQQLRETPSRH